MEPDEINNNNLFKNLREFFNKEIIVWGTGRYAEETIQKSFLFKNSKVLFYVDKNFQKKLNHSVKGKIFDPSEIKKYSNPIFIASSTYWHEIYQQIQDKELIKQSNQHDGYLTNLCLINILTVFSILKLKHLTYWIYLLYHLYHHTRLRHPSQQV